MIISVTEVFNTCTSHIGTVRSIQQLINGYFEIAAYLYILLNKYGRLFEKVDTARLTQCGLTIHNMLNDNYLAIDKTFFHQKKVAYNINL